MNFLFQIYDGETTARTRQAQHRTTFSTANWLIGAGLAVVTLAIYAQVKYGFHACAARPSRRSNRVLAAGDSVQPNGPKAHAELGVALAKQNRTEAALELIIRCTARIRRNELTISLRKKY